MIKSFEEFLKKFSVVERKDFSEAGKEHLWKIYKEGYQQDDDNNEGLSLCYYAEYANSEELKHDYNENELQELEACGDIKRFKNGSYFIYKI